MLLVLLIYYYYYCYCCYYSPLDCCTVPVPAKPDLVVLDIPVSDRLVQCVVGLPIVTMTFFFVVDPAAVDMEEHATVFHSPWMMIDPPGDNMDPVAVVDNLQMQVPTMEVTLVVGMVYSCMHYDYSPSVEVVASSSLVVEEEE